MGEHLIIEVDDLKKYFPIRTGIMALFNRENNQLRAVDGISFTLSEGKIFGLVGESGCGKTTTGKLLAGLLPPTDGSIKFKGSEVKVDRNLKDFREKVQMIFQDPYESINDRFTIKKWVEEPLIIHKKGNRKQRLQKVCNTLSDCGLKPPTEFLSRYPHELSGGQRQRVVIARAMVLDPEFLIADEPTSMLDVSLKAAILKVLKELTAHRNLATLYISHNLALTRLICQEIGVMYQGKFAEFGSVKKVLTSPLHPYTKALVSAVPRIDPTSHRKRVKLTGEVSKQIGASTGCRFASRCPKSSEKCEVEEPELVKKDECWVACHFVD